MLAAYVCTSLLLLRFLLLLPARAVGNNNLTFAETWQRTKGNTWRLLWGLLLSWLPPLLLAEAILLSTGILRLPPIPAQGQLDGLHAFLEQMPLIGAGSMVFVMFVSTIMIGFLSFAYRHFFETARPPG